MMIATQIDLMSPVHHTPGDPANQPEQRVARCLCGGGYRAMAFHFGVLRRHNEVGLLPRRIATTFSETPASKISWTRLGSSSTANLESVVLLRFSKPDLGDCRVGRIMKPDLPLAVAVAASSAFSPVRSPCTLDLRGQTWITDEGNDIASPGFRDEIRVTDGGIYDNLGITSRIRNFGDAGLRTHYLKDNPQGTPKTGPPYPEQVLS
jgi:hypothetical protein